MKPGALARSVARTISDARGAGFVPREESPVTGGSIHEAMRLDGDLEGREASFFVKSCERARAPMLEAEAEGLAALAGAGAVRVPGRVAAGDDGEHAWLVLEWLELSPLGPASAARLGEALAEQHRAERPAFGWPRDNFIGASPQRNAQGSDWVAFWSHQRLHPQLRLAAGNRLPTRLIDRGERLAADCGVLLAGHRPRPSLLHGDLWGGNAAALADGTPVVFDPATYAGDREADIAMTELFGGFPPDFRAAYEARLPLADGYATRRDLYNAYHLLNHANLFAGPYVAQAGTAIDRLLSEIG